MRIRRLVLLQAMLVAGAGCAGGGEADTVGAVPAPTAVSCADASQLKQRALEDRRNSGEVTGDRAKIVSGSRAKFLASLAHVAELKCLTNVADGDTVLVKAFDAVRAAETTSSEYEAAIKWIEADLMAADAVTLLISRLPVPASR